jgi:small conductance mechanosensitive channel
MTRKLVSECGLPEDSLRGSIVDFATITGSDYLMISSRDGRSVCYYAAGTDTVFGKILHVAAVVSLIFAVVLALLLLILLRGYNEKSYLEWEEIREKTLEHIRQRRARREEAYGLDENGEAKKGVIRRLLALIDWDRRSAGGKAAVILHIGMDILIVCVLNILNERLLPNDSSGTMLRFFMDGEWMRGLNLFSLCGILLLIAIAYLVNVLCSLLIKLTGSIFSPSGETLIRLLYSSIRYVTAIAVFCYGLDYLGFSTGTIVASLGVLSLALSLGAQDLIKDILAGLAIVFDGSFRIGDVVEVDGTEGIVQEIGVRATKLTVEGNNTLYINNSEISSVLNKSKELSRINLEFRIPINESLPKLEELLNRELPEIGRKNSKIVKGPELLGLTGLSGAAASRVIQLAIEVMIDQKDEAEVKSYLYREIHLLFEREGIDIE